MELFIKFIFYLLIYFINFNLFSYQFQNYEDYLTDLEKIDINQNLKLQLIFSRVESIYLVFYDKKRKEIYIQFKKDIYDDTNKKVQSLLISGQPYQIECELIGYFRNHTFITITNEDLKNFENFKKNILICQFKSFYPLVIDEIIF